MFVFLSGSLAEFCVLNESGTVHATNCSVSLRINLSSLRHCLLNRMRVRVLSNDIHGELFSQT